MGVANFPLLVQSIIETPLGPLRVVVEDEKLTRLDFQRDDSEAIGTKSMALAQLREELERYFSGERVKFRTLLAPQGTPFQQTVWKALRTIPYGKTWSYAQLAQEIGRPTAYRAVARANATNPIAILIPCHRVIAADGKLSGYAGGVERKRGLLDLEQGPAPLDF